MENSFGPMVINQARFVTDNEAENHLLTVFFQINYQHNFIYRWKKHKSFQLILHDATNGVDTACPFCGCIIDSPSVCTKLQNHRKMIFQKLNKNPSIRLRLLFEGL